MGRIRPLRVISPVIATSLGNGFFVRADMMADVMERNWKESSGGACCAAGVSPWGEAGCQGREGVFTVREGEVLEAIREVSRRARDVKERLAGFSEDVARRASLEEELESLRRERSRLEEERVAARSERMRFLGHE